MNSLILKHRARFPEEDREDYEILDFYVGKHGYDRLSELGFEDAVTQHREEIQDIRARSTSFLDEAGRGLRYGLNLFGQSKPESFAAGMAYQAGYPGIEAKLLESAREDLREAEQYAPIVPRVQEISNVREAGLWAVGQIAQLVPQMGVTTTGALAGLAAGAAVGGPAGAAVGAAAGAFVPSMVMNQTYEELRSQGVSPDRAFKYGMGQAVPAALLDIILPVKVAAGTVAKHFARKGMKETAEQSLSRAIKETTDAVAKAKNVPFVKRAAKGALVGASIEAPTEVAQEVLAIMAEHYAHADDPTWQDMSEDQIKDRLINAFAAGALMGKTVGAAATVFGSSQEKADLEAQLG